MFSDDESDDGDKRDEGLDLATLDAPSATSSSSALSKPSASPDAASASSSTTTPQPSIQSKSQPLSQQAASIKNAQSFTQSGLFPSSVARPPTKVASSTSSSSSASSSAPGALRTRGVSLVDSSMADMALESDNEQQSKSSSTSLSAISMPPKDRMATGESPSKRPKVEQKQQEKHPRSKTGVATHVLATPTSTVARPYIPTSALSLIPSQVHVPAKYRRKPPSAGAKSLSATETAASSSSSHSFEDATEDGDAYQGDEDEDDDGVDMDLGADDEEDDDFEMAKTYKFELDDFQKKAIRCLEKDQNVLVTAHTSAGKTVVAEYAIARALKKSQRVIYTSPIKALSNQKFNEFREEFGEVGLMTGDITKNATAGCLVMTTEILRNMLYRGNEMMREVGCVIFDEVHYMRDRERGVVWEESIVLLSSEIQCVFLSATLSNAADFASWCAHLKQRPCHVISTDVRPVPLQHYIFPNGGQGIYLIKDGEKPFDHRAYSSAESSFDKTFQEKSAQQRREMDGWTDVRRVVEMLKQSEDLPIIMFCFSRRETEGRALELSNMELNTPEEAEKVKVIFESAIAQLKEEDRDLRQIRLLLPLLQRGVGIHHSGLLLILKEIIELLFQESLLKILFATETFAIGINMPAKTVVFTQVQKFDGKEFRFLTPGEYIQMSGRAGRRGKDDKGICVLMSDGRFSADDAEKMVSGRPDPITSSFTLSYPMVLNLIKVDVADPESVIASSFHQFEFSRMEPERQKEFFTSEKKQHALKDELEKHKDVDTFYKLTKTLESLEDELKKKGMTPAVLQPFLQPGRLLFIDVPPPTKFGRRGQPEPVKPEDEKSKADKSNSESSDPPTGSGPWGWGILIRYIKRYEPDHYVAEVLVNCHAVKKNGQTQVPMPVTKPDESGEPMIVRFSLAAIKHISAVRVFIQVPDMRHVQNRVMTMDLIDQAKQQFQGQERHGLPLLDPFDDMKIEQHFSAMANGNHENEITKLTERINMIKARLVQHPVFLLPLAQRNELFEKCKESEELDKKLEVLRAASEKSQMTLFRDELKRRLSVLRRLGHIDGDDVVQLKGRVASYIESVDSLVLTELIFEGVFADLSGSECVAVLSVLFQREKCTPNNNDVPQAIVDRLSGVFQEVVNTAQRIADVIDECRVEIDREEFLKKFDDSMMLACHAWCEGKQFAEVCALVDMFEGSVVRLMRRIQELLLMLVEAAKNIGNSSLEDKFVEAIRVMKRGIVFASSLYLD